MNISPKIHTKLLTIKIEPELFDIFQRKAGRRKMSSIIRDCINEFLSKNNSYLDDIDTWREELERKKKNGTFNIKNDPLYNIEGFDLSAPEDFSVNHDRYIYGGK